MRMSACGSSLNTEIKRSTPVSFIYEVQLQEGMRVNLLVSAEHIEALDNVDEASGLVSLPLLNSLDRFANDDEVVILALVVNANSVSVGASHLEMSWWGSLVVVMCK